jgi:hypothetical protein
VNTEQGGSIIDTHPSNLLNEQQRICLQVIAEMDRENERRFGQKRNRAEKGEPPPPEAWRWLQYDPLHKVSEPELERRLQEVGIGGGGIKATMKALLMKRACQDMADAGLDRQPNGPFRSCRIILVLTGKRRLRLLLR